MQLSVEHLPFILDSMTWPMLKRLSLTVGVEEVETNPLPQPWNLFFKRHPALERLRISPQFLLAAEVIDTESLPALQYLDYLRIRHQDPHPIHWTPFPASKPVIENLTCIKGFKADILFSQFGSLPQLKIFCGPIVSTQYSNVLQSIHQCAPNLERILVTERYVKIEV